VSAELLRPFWYKLPTSNNRPEARQARRHDASDELPSFRESITAVFALLGFLAIPLAKAAFGVVAVTLAIALTSDRDDHCKKDGPHYGYRYGRWYYGHGHRYGCQNDPKKAFGCSDI